MPDTNDPEHILDGLNEAQRQAVLATSGPVAILAGAGTGKTRVISRRAGYAIATGIVPAGEVLLVTFTDKAATEMVERMRELHHPGVTARTFHAHALSQLRHFWPASHGGSPAPQILESKFPILGRIARSLPGGYRFAPVKDLASEIEWAKNRRIGAGEYVAAAAAERREAPIPIELMARAFADYERAKVRAGRIDFEDMLGATIDLLEADAAAAAIVRARKRWFSVDEYQDTNPLQESLLALWAGPSRDLCVVGDEDQTIFGFTGASSRYLRDFARTHPGTTVVKLTENYRSSPEILGLANRLIASTGRTKDLLATRPSGPAPSRVAYANPAAELAGLVAAIRARIDEGIAPAEIAILVRLNAQLEPLESALTAAEIPYVVRGGRFYERPDVRAAIREIQRFRPAAADRDLPAAIQAVFGAAFGYDPDASPRGPEERERMADLAVLLAIAAAFSRPEAGSSTPPGVPEFLAELARRDAGERANLAGGVTLSTIHRAKGLEWDAVFLPGLEEGNLPIGQAAGDPAAIDEERRLLYVGITRARLRLAISWAQRRAGPNGREGSRRPSRFIGDLGLLPVRDQPSSAPNRSSAARERITARPIDDGRFEALRTWRAEQARSDGVPAYVIAHDATLVAIAQARPVSIAELSRVRGMGPVRLERYGLAILAALARG